MFDNFIDFKHAFIFLFGFRIIRKTNQSLTSEQLLFKTTILLQQGPTLQKTQHLVTHASLSCDSIYNISSTMRRSGVGIGYGKKSDFTKDLTVSPGATKYQIKTIFDNNRSSRKGFSMYESREVYMISFRNFPIEDIFLWIL